MKYKILVIRWTYEYNKLGKTDEPYTEYQFFINDELKHKSNKDLYVNSLTGFKKSILKKYTGINKDEIEVETVHQRHPFIIN